MRIRQALVVVALATSSSYAVGQERPPTATNRAAARRAALAAIEQPDATSAFSLPKPKLSLQGSKDGNKVVGTIGIAFTSHTLDFQFSGPIGDGDDESSPLTLDGLANTAFVQLGFTGSVAVKKTLLAADLRAINEFCGRLTMADDCDSSAMTPSDRARFLRLFMNKVPVYYGIHAKVGGNQFSFTTMEAIGSDVTEKHNSFAGVASVGLLTPGMWFIAGHVEAQQFYQAAGQPQQLCVPLSIAGASTCRTSTVGAPKKTKETILTLEGRRIYVGRGVALNPTVRYGTQEDVTTVELPVHFLQEKTDPTNPVPGLNGGISVGWHSKEGVLMRAFVGVAFNLIDLREP